jgi:ribose transport system ATP-binding protein
MSDVLLRAEGVSRSFGNTRALDDVDIVLGRGEIHALLGSNGSGKSTLVKILAGVERADAGMLLIGGERHDLSSHTPSDATRLGLRFIHQQDSTFPDLTVAENLALGPGFDTGAGFRIRWRSTRRRAAALLARYRVDAHPDQIMGELRPATQKMVTIARTLQDQDSPHDGVLVLDEPTASLPDAEARLVLDALQAYTSAGLAIIYITHRLEEVLSVADSATLLGDGRVLGVVDPRGLTHDDLVEQMLGRPVEQVARQHRPVPDRLALEVEKLRAGPLQDVDLRVRVGETVGVAGLLGSGRSSLLKAIFGLLPVRAGRVQVEGRSLQLRDPRRAIVAGVAYLPEDRARDGLFPNLSLRENLSLTVADRYWRRVAIDQRAERRDTIRLLSDFGIRAPSPDAPITALSGGNQQKAMLARWMRRHPRVLLLDEPTQGVDVGARAEIYALMQHAASEGAATIVVSSDPDELAVTCDRVVVLARGRVVNEVAGDQLDAERIERSTYARGHS